MTCFNLIFSQCSASVEKVLAINDRSTEILVLLFKYYISEGVKLVLQPIQVLGRRYHQQATEGLGLKGVPKKEHSSEFKHKFCRPPQTTHPFTHSTTRVSSNIPNKLNTEHPLNRDLQWLAGGSACLVLKWVVVLI